MSDCSGKAFYTSFVALLLVAYSLEDLLMARDTLIFILQHLGFLINIVLPRANIDFRIFRSDIRFWNEMTLSLLKEETPQSTEALPGNPRKGESNSQGTK